MGSIARADVPDRAYYSGCIPLQRADGLLLVLDTPKGRGVFAGKDIPARTVLEVSPVLVLDPQENNEHIKKTDLYNYTYNWPYKALKSFGKEAEIAKNLPAITQAVVFGLGSMFNHSALRQNVGWERNVEKLFITYTALRNIAKGEELCISYGPRLTFVDTEAEENKSDDDADEILGRIDID